MHDPINGFRRQECRNVVIRKYSDVFLGVRDHKKNKKPSFILLRLLKKTTDGGQSWGKLSDVVNFFVFDKIDDTCCWTIVLSAFVVAYSTFTVTYDGSHTYTEFIITKMKNG